MRITIRVCLAVLMGTILTAGTVLGHWNELGYGPRAVGMGQAQAGAATDSAAVIYNPAALVQARERWGLEGRGIWVQYTQVTYSPELEMNGINQNYWLTEGSVIGALIPVGKRLTFGVQLIMTSDITLAAILAEGPAFTRYQPMRNPQGGFGVGLKITDKLSVGFSQLPTIHINANTIVLDLATILADFGLAIGDPSVNIPPHIELDALPGSSYQFGALLRPVKWLSIGASYKYRNGARVHIPIYLPPSLLPELTLIVEGKYWDTPTQLLFGVGIFPNESLTIAFDMVYSMWSRTKPWVRFRSSDPTLIDIPYPDVELMNTWNPRFGIEWADSLRGKFSRVDYALRAGYSFSESPFPPAADDLKDIDNDAHYMSGGFSLGYRPKKRMSYIGVEYFFQYVDLVERSHRDIDRNPAIIVSDGYAIYYGIGATIKP